jgi:hypothetical protein
MAMAGSNTNSGRFGNGLMPRRGGLLGAFLGPQQPQGLLGYNPAAMRRSALSRGLLMAGAELLGQGPSPVPIGFGQSIGVGLKGFAQGVDEGRQQYKDDWKDQYAMSELERKQTERTNRDAKIKKWIASQAPETQQELTTLYDANPDLFADEWVKSKFDAPEAPSWSYVEPQADAWGNQTSPGGFVNTRSKTAPQLPGYSDIQTSPLPPFSGTQSQGQGTAPNMQALAQRWLPGVAPKVIMGNPDLQEFLASKASDPTDKRAFPQWDQERRKSSATTISMAGENEYAKTRGKGFAETANKIDADEQAAFKTINALNAMEQQIADPKFYSGIGSSQVQTLKRTAAAIGIDSKAVTSIESFNSLSKQAALDVMGGSLGTGFSNADRDFVIDQVPNLGNTPEGNKALINIHMAMQGRKIEIARMARAYEQENGRLDASFFAELSEWAEQNPLFTDDSGNGTTTTNVPWKRLD